jgi:hypothetical protein
MGQEPAGHGEHPAVEIFAFGLGGAFDFEVLGGREMRNRYGGHIYFILRDDRICSF